ncbi:DNA repair protein RecO [Alkalilimnicola ehrlichii]|uniref:DNA repair protein RecO n=1 Tax=Alkalilimnicola ehrlichii TaxID=351052 RepID=A0A3E0X267_9GAMM|nr:DNA repair protein RecO [Alkalilimnicola ehrlichii]RFA28346.1 DNA repair protein RecO [Alkalilimnicola ehrlichii]RFA38590.1 DNA repair protein RecO [Alkalilimnicola ehrlichii]
MEQQRFVLEPGFVLHQHAYGENHAIIELFTRELGRVGVVARGVRSPRSRRRGLLQPFGELLLSWQSRGELGQLSGVEPKGMPMSLSGKRILSGFYLNEVLLRLVRREDPHPELYDAYRETLKLLAEGGAEGDTLRLFEKRLLAELGYGLLLDTDIEGEPIEPDVLYDYRLEQGPVRAGMRPALPIHGTSLLALAAEQLDSPIQRREVKHLMRHALSAQLGDKPLKSRELYAQRLGQRQEGRKR